MFRLKIHYTDTFRDPKVSPDRSLRLRKASESCVFRPIETVLRSSAIVPTIVNFNVIIFAKLTRKCVDVIVNTFKSNGLGSGAIILGPKGGPRENGPRTAHEKKAASPGYTLKSLGSASNPGKPTE